jgi:hypothetical protein
MAPLKKTKPEKLEKNVDIIKQILQKIWDLRQKTFSIIILRLSAVS